MKEYQIIKATDNDINQIQHLADIIFRDTYKEILSSEQMDYMMEWMYSTESLQKQFSDGHIFYIAYNEGVACGYMSIQPEGAAEDGTLEFHLQKLYILPSEQGCGLGRKLIRHAVTFARECSCGQRARIRLNVNRDNPAVEFYKHLGMKILSQGDFPIGHGFYMNDYIMGMDA